MQILFIRNRGYVLVVTSLVTPGEAHTGICTYENMLHEAHTSLVIDGTIS